MSRMFTKGNKIVIDAKIIPECLKPPNRNVSLSKKGEDFIRQGGNSGRIYLPREWIGKHVRTKLTPVQEVTDEQWGR